MLISMIACLLTLSATRPVFAASSATIGNSEANPYDPSESFRLLFPHEISRSPRLATFWSRAEDRITSKLEVEPQRATKYRFFRWRETIEQRVDDLAYQFARVISEPLIEGEEVERARRGIAIYADLVTAVAHNLGGPNSVYETLMFSGATLAAIGIGFYSLDYPVLAIAIAGPGFGGIISSIVEDQKRDLNQVAMNQACVARKMTGQFWMRVAAHFREIAPNAESGPPEATSKIIDWAGQRFGDANKHLVEGCELWLAEPTKG